MEEKKKIIRKVILVIALILLCAITIFADDQDYTYIRSVETEYSDYHTRYKYTITPFCETYEIYFSSNNSSFTKVYGPMDNGAYADPEIGDVYGYYTPTQIGYYKFIGWDDLGSDFITVHCQYLGALPSVSLVKDGNIVEAVTVRPVGLVADNFTYTFYKDGVQIYNGRSNTLNAVNYGSGKYTVRTNYPNWESSPLSSRVTVTVSLPQLTAPIVEIEDNVLQWESVTNAQVYDVYFINSSNESMLLTSTQSNYVNLDRLLDGFQFYVVAKGTNFNDSNHSNTVTLTYVADDIDVDVRPELPDNPTVLDYLAYIVDSVGWFFRQLFRDIESLIQPLSNISDFINESFSWIPAEIRTILITGISIILIVSIIKIVRG